MRRGPTYPREMEVGLALIIGGARSGKSAFGVRLARRWGGERVAYIATCVPGDAELLARVAAHRASRPAQWLTIEEPLEIVDAAAAALQRGLVALIDCMTLWLFNMLQARRADDVPSACSALIQAAATGTIIAISNELGCGIVPADPDARRFRDLHGRMNQQLAAGASHVFAMFAGLPLQLKPRLALCQLAAEPTGSEAAHNLPGGSQP